MILLNTTFVVNTSVATDVLKWIKDVYLESSGKFALTHPAPMVTKVLGSTDRDTCSYALHIYFADLAAARKWDDGVAMSLRDIMRKRWGEKVLTFATYLEAVQ